MKQLKGRAVRKDKNELDHPSLTKDVKDCLRRTWLDGEVYLSDTRLYSLLCQLLGEAAEKTGRKQLVPMEDWTEVASELSNWTTGANKGPDTDPGSFQLALVKERTVEFNNLPVSRNIIEHWVSILLADPNLNDIAEKKHSFKASIQGVHRPACIDYIKSINHELARRNRNNSKKSAPGREEWYVVSATTCAAWYECNIRQLEDTTISYDRQPQPQTESRANAAAAPGEAAATVGEKAT